MLWGDSPISGREVLTRLQAQGRDLAYTTVMTYLGRLEQKGCVRRRKKGVAHLYEPVLSRDRVERSRTRSLVDELYDGAAAPLILRLVRESRLSTEEIEELQSLISELDVDPPAESGRGRSKKKNRKPGRRGGRAS